MTKQARTVLHALLLGVVLTAACTRYDESQSGGDHVWKSQTDALERARRVEGVVHDAAQLRRQQLDEQSR
jgi:hypothetical protein